MESPDLEDYIFAQKQDRETVAIKRLFTLGGGLLARWFEPTLRWSMPWVLFGLRIPHERLLRGYNRPPKKFLGDVDVFGASLEASSPEEYRRYRTEAEGLFSGAAPGRLEEAVVNAMVMKGKTKWPPDLSYIAASEVKAAHFNARGDLKGAGDKYNGRDQALELCKMGFDRVALGRFVVMEPVNPPNYHPWMVASARSGMAMDDYLDETKGIFVKEDDPYGTVLVSSGAVPGKLEYMAGTTSAPWLRKPPDNRFKEEAADARKVIEENLLEVMSRHPVPRTVPILILACSDDKCGHLYVTGSDPYVVCPNCGGSPR